MKKIILIFSILFSFTANAQALNEAKKIYDKVENKVGKVLNNTVDYSKKTINIVDTSSNFKMIYNDVKDGVKALATSLKTTSERLFEILCKKYIISGIFKLTLCIVLTCFIFLIVNFLKKRFKEDKELDNDLTVPISVSSFFILIVLLVIIYNNLETGLLYTFNPEYYALEEIIQKIKEIKR